MHRKLPHGILRLSHPFRSLCCLPRKLPSLYLCIMVLTMFLWLHSLPGRHMHYNLSTI